MKPIKNYFLLLSAVILLASGVKAYETDTDKAPILSTAMNIYTQCFPYDTLYDRDDGAKERVIEGYVAIDEGLGFSFFDMFSLKGGEVFSANEMMSDKSDISMWYDLKTGLYENSDNHNRLLFIGGLFNILEELSIPKDAVSVLKGITPDINRINNALLHNNVVCNDVEMNNETLEQIRDNSIQKAQDLLEEYIPNCPGVRWREFLLTPNSDSTCMLNNNDSRYKEFVYKLHFNAVNAELKLLNWSNKNILKK